MKEVIFHELVFETSDLELEATKSSIKHTTSCYQSPLQDVFSFIIISQLWWPIELKFSQVCYFMHICWDTPSEKAGLWQLPIVSTVIKMQLSCSVFNKAILTSMSFCDISHASPKPTMRGVGRVPLRIPLSWPPPLWSASMRTRGRRRTYNAPMPVKAKISTNYYGGNALYVSHGAWVLEQETSS